MSSSVIADLFRNAYWNGYNRPIIHVVGFNKDCIQIEKHEEL